MKLVDLKMKKAELRNRMDEERKTRKGIMVKTFYEYRDVIEELRYLESRLLKPIAISILVFLILATSGCGTMAGFQSDIHQVTRPTTLERK